MKSSFDVKLLMGIQYNLPLTETPLIDLAENLGYDKEYVLKETLKLIKDGIIKRYGANLNYKAFKEVKKAALVGFNVEHDRVFEVAEKINRIDILRLKHNFLREHERYNVWFTIKAESFEKINEIVDEIANQCGISDYVILPTKRVWKMDVKYDLIKGVSWSNKGIEPESIPTIDELGFDREIVRKFESLIVSERPFKEFESYGYKENEIVEIIKELLKKGVVRDFSGVLRESKIGFKENGMTLLKINSKTERVVVKLIENYPQITHLVERISHPNWGYSIYFMVHAVKKDPIENIRNEVMEFDGVVDAVTVYSKKNLRED